MPLTFTIRLSTGTRWEISLPDGDTSNAVTNTSVLRIKEHLLSSQHKEKHEYLSNCTSPSDLRLIFKGRIMENERLLADYGISPNATLFLVKSTPTGTGATSTTTTSTTPTSTAPPPPSPTNNNFPPPNLFGSNPWMQQQQPPSQSNNNTMNNPMMNNPMGNPQEMLNNPMLQSMLQNNPEFVRTMMQQQMESNPQMRALLDANPQMRHMFNDPAAWDQALELMRNPAAMQQAMRSQDLAMSQLENMPGGMAALQNMYSQYQEPLQEMSSGGSGTAGTDSSNPTDGSAGARGQAMPNPWGDSTSASTTPRSSSSNNNSNANANANFNPWAGAGGASATSGASNNNAANNSSNPWGAANNNNMMMNGLMMPPPGVAGTNMETMMNDPNYRHQMLNMLESNPAMQQMMQQSIQQNPEFFRNMIAQQNPALAQMLGPQGIDAMMQQMMNPQALRAMMNLQDQMQQNSGGAAAGTASNSGSGGMDFSSLWGVPPLAGTNLGAGGPNVNNNNNQNPAERYSRQLQSLYNMGFDDEQRNLQALQAVHGNLNRAVDWLLETPLPEENTTAPAAASSSTANDPNNGDESTETPDAAPHEPKGDNDKKND